MSRARRTAATAVRPVVLGCEEPVPDGRRRGRIRRSDVNAAGALGALDVRVHEEAFELRHPPPLARPQLNDVGADDHHDVRLLQFQA